MSTTTAPTEVAARETAEEIARNLSAIRGEYGTHTVENLTAIIKSTIDTAVLAERERCTRIVEQPFQGAHTSEAAFRTQLVNQLAREIREGE